MAFQSSMNMVCMNMVLKMSNHWSNATCSISCHCFIHFFPSFHQLRLSEIFLASLVSHQIYSQISLHTRDRQICAISFHRPTASSRLHYLITVSQLSIWKTQTTRLHTQDGLIHHISGIGFEMIRNCQLLKSNSTSNRLNRCGRESKHLRGAPSAISMAVIPRDQISLCETHISQTNHEFWCFVLTALCEYT